MGNNTQDTVERRSISMYPADWAIVERKASELGGVNVSLALRLIVREWEDYERMLISQIGQLDHTRIVELANAFVLGHITEQEFKQEATITLYQVRIRGAAAVAA